MDWARAGDNWPHRESSRFVSSGARRWFVQQWPAPSPKAPQLLLLHGTGASSHSWRSLAPLLAQQAGGPLLAGGDPALALADPAALTGWNTLRQSEAAPWIGLAAPRVLLRRHPTAGVRVQAGP